ncbi:hypothetical protein TRICI_006083 [Trichomonascus ciferrii]|uniref:F-box domain-containing protein n=1 Tax=Trichomonascus ciferrii TaxID=44093 RepID=A0A642UNK6_9ASCO|nr:hypothetical protein TRICI_006083 [Trichomonascus ciferrii]
MRLDLLPQDIYEIVFEYLDCVDLLGLRLVSRCLNDAVDHSNAVNIILEINQDAERCFWGTTFSVTLGLREKDSRGVPTSWPEGTVEDLKNYKMNVFKFWLPHVKMLYLQEESIEGQDMYEFVDTIIDVFEQNKKVGPLNVWLSVFINGEKSARIIDRVEKSPITKVFDLTIVARRELRDFEEKDLMLGEKARYIEVFHYPFKTPFPPVGLKFCQRLEYLNVDGRSQYILVDLPKLLSALEGKDSLKSIYLTGAGIMSSESDWRPLSVPQLILLESNRVPETVKVKLNFQETVSLKRHANFVRPTSRVKCDVKRLCMTDSTLEYFDWFDFSSLEELRISYNMQENIYLTSVKSGGFENLDKLIVRMHDWNEFFTFTEHAFKHTPLRILELCLIRAHNDLEVFSPHLCHLRNLQVLALSVWNYDRGPDEFFEAFEDFIQPFLLHCPKLRAVSVKITCYPYSIEVTGPVLNDFRMFMNRNNGSSRGAISNDTKSLYNNLESWQCQIGLDSKDFDYLDSWDRKINPSNLIQHTI